MKVYKEGGRSSEVAVALRGNSLRAVTLEGEHITYLFDFVTMAPLEGAIDELKDRGFRTDFAEWGIHGEMTKLLEEFE